MNSRRPPARLDLRAVRERLRSLEHATESDEPGARASVAIVLRERAPGWGAEILLIQRAEHPNDPWSGHVAFPGGRRDPTDESAIHTAEREAREEVGLDLRAHGELLWRMHDLPAIARGRRVGMVISPVVYALREGHDGEDLALDRGEVASVLWVSLETLADESLRETFTYVHEGHPLELPCVRLEGGRVLWGLTFQMVSRFLHALREPSTRD
jgi:8-oxo-dGTP pyrophosphatase MutT (NUDIX family)